MCWWQGGGGAELKLVPAVLDAAAVEELPMRQETYYEVCTLTQPERRRPPPVGRTPIRVRARAPGLTRFWARWRWWARKALGATR